MRFLLADQKRALCEPSFFMATLTGSLLMIASALYIIYVGYENPLSLFQQSHSLFLPFVAPLLAAIPYSTMNMTEQSSGYATFMSLRQGNKTWQLRRFWVNGITGGITLLVPTLVLLAISILCGLGGEFVVLYQLLGLNFYFGFSFASLSYGLTFLNIHTYLPHVAPQVLYFFAIYTFPILGLSAYYPPLAFSPYIFPSLASMSYAITFLTVVTGVGLLLTLLGKCKETKWVSALREVTGR